MTYKLVGNKETNSDWAMGTRETKNKQTRNNIRPDIKTANEAYNLKQIREIKLKLTL